MARKNVVILMVFVLLVGLISPAEYSNSIAKTKNAPTVTGDYVKGEAIVVMDAKSAPAKAANRKKAIASVHSDVKIMKSYNFSDTAIKGKKKMIGKPEGGYYIERIQSDTLSTEELIQEYGSAPDVAFVEPNYIYKATQISDDTYSKFQDSLDDDYETCAVSGSSIHVKKGWDKVKNSKKDVVVAIIDTGVNYNHEDLKDVMWENDTESLYGEHGYDFCNNDDYPMDDNSHGTHVAGTIAAIANNQKGIAGIGKNVKLMALKYLSNKGSGNSANCIGCYEYMIKAKQQGTNIVAVNNSWGGPSQSLSMKLAIEEAYELGIVSLAAAGNENTDLDSSPLYPASTNCDGILSIAAAGKDGTPTCFTCYGKNNVDVAFPGDQILSCCNEDTFTPSIYSEEDQKRLTSNYFDGSDYDGYMKNSYQKYTITNNVQTELTDDSIVRTASTSAVYAGSDKRSLRIDIPNAKANTSYAIRFNVWVPSSTTDYYYSNMLRIGNVHDTNDSTLDVKIMYGSSYTDAKKIYSASPVANQGFWRQITEKIPFTQNAQDYTSIYYVVTPTKDGNYHFYLDDIGISKENVSSDQLGQYIYYSGTSMATPAASGTFALLSQLYDSPEMAYDKMLTSVNYSDVWADKCRAEGTFDFDQLDSKNMVIKDATVNMDNEIELSGLNFGTSKGSISISGQSLSASDITSWNNTTITIKKDSLLNTTPEIYVTQGNMTRSIRTYLYSAKKVPDILSYESSGASNMVSSGSHVYTWYMGDLYEINNTDDGYIRTKIATFTSDVISDELTDYECMTDGISPNTRLAYSNGSLWFVVQCTEDYDSSSVFLIQYNLQTKSFENMGKVPANIRNLSSSTFTSYNDSLYFIGGYDYENECISDKVYCYSLSTHEYSEAAPLPYARIGAGANQIGDTLVVSFGTRKENDRYTQAGITTFDGTEWKESKTDLSDIVNTSYQSTFNQTIPAYIQTTTTSLGKLVILSRQAEHLGDIFTYSLADGSLTPTDYKLGLTPKGCALYATSCQNKVYLQKSDCIDYLYNGETYYDIVTCAMPMTSDLYTLQDTSEHGCVSGAGIYVPGEKITLTANAGKGYKLTAFYVDGKKIDGFSTTVFSNKNMDVKAITEKETPVPTPSSSPVPTTVPTSTPPVASPTPVATPTPKKATKIKVKRIALSAKSKKASVGKRVKIRATITPKNATKKALTWKSLNRKYATVSKTGTVSFKKASSGKKVKIQALATDGSKKKATIQFRVKKVKSKK